MAARISVVSPQTGNGTMITRVACGADARFAHSLDARQAQNNPQEKDLPRKPKILPAMPK